MMQNIIPELILLKLGEAVCNRNCMEQGIIFSHQKGILLVIKKNNTALLSSKNHPQGPSVLAYFYPKKHTSNY